MKRSPLKRKTPFRRSCVLRSSKPMSKKRSKRARAKDFPASVRRIVYERSEGMCELCGKKRIAHLHHAIYRSQGGTGELSNALGLCLECHNAVHTYRAIRELCVEKAKQLAEGGVLDGASGQAVRS